jgi:hypothetical protein
LFAAAARGFHFGRVVVVVARVSFTAAAENTPTENDILSE